MPLDYSLRVFTPILSTPKTLVADVTTGAANWKRSIRSHGGYWVGSFRLQGPIDFLQDFFANRLGYHLEESVGVKTWEGMIYDMELQTSGVTRRRTFDDMYNAVKTAYINQNNEGKITSFNTDTQSIASYGRREVILARDGLQLSAAEKVRDTFLKENTWPWARPVAVLRRTRQPTLIVRACGYVFTGNWRYVTVITELDQETGGTMRASWPPPDRFKDEGQDFSQWQTLAGNASYSIFIKNTDDTITSAWCGAAATEVNPNDTILAYQDQALTTAGYNDTAPAGHVPASYFIYGPSSDWISSIISTDLPFITEGKIVNNRAQVKRGLFINDKCWDIFDEIAGYGSDTDDKPWRFAVLNERLAHYEEVDTTVRYYIRRGEIFTDAGAQKRANPWTVQPGVFRDIEYPLKAVGGSNPWLSDARDVFVEEVEASQRGITLKPTDDFGQSEIMSGGA